MYCNEISVNMHYRDLNPVSFGSEKCEKNHSYGPAIRTYWLLHFVNSGHGKFTIDNKTYKIKKGDIFVIPPYKETFYKADSVDPWDYTWIGFDAGIELPDVFNNAIIKNQNSEKFFSKMKKCIYMGNNKNAFLCSCLWELISSLIVDVKNPTNYADIAQNIIESDYMSDLKIANIATRLNINRSYLFNVFKQKKGISPQQYLLNVRMNKAAELMTKYNETITVAAMSVGYTDIYHFSKSFKKQFGVSPRKYCEEYKKAFF